MKNLIKSFGFAARGVFYAVKERNFRIDICAAVLAVWFSILYGLEKAEWLLLILICAFVLSGEMINTAIETLCARVTEKRDEKIKRTKDIAAGAVLLRAAAAVTAAVFLFGDLQKLKAAIFLFAKPVRLTALILFIVLSAIFVFLPEKKKKKRM